LVLVESTDTAVSQLRLLNLADHSSLVVPTQGLGLPLGWSPAGDLVYLTQGEGRFAPAYAYELRLFSPQTQLTLSLSAEPLVTPWGNQQSWSADGTMLAIALVAGARTESDELSIAPGVITLTPPMQVLRLPVQGYAAALAPDGQRLAYVAGSLSPEEMYSTPRSLDIVNLATGAVSGRPTAGGWPSWTTSPTARTCTSSTSAPPTRPPAAICSA
jgi:hypothetical protein